MLLARIGFVVGVVGGGREGKYFSISTEYTLQGRDVTLVCTRFTLLLLVVGHVEAAAADRGWPSSGLTLRERLGCVILAPQTCASSFRRDWKSAFLDFTLAVVHPPAISAHVLVQGFVHVHGFGPWGGIVLVYGAHG